MTYKKITVLIVILFIAFVFFIHANWESQPIDLHDLPYDQWPGYSNVL